MERPAGAAFRWIAARDTTNDLLKTRKLNSKVWFVLLGYLQPIQADIFSRINSSYFFANLCWEYDDKDDSLTSYFTLPVF